MYTLTRALCLIVPASLRLEPQVQLSHRPSFQDPEEAQLGVANPMTYAMVARTMDTKMAPAVPRKLMVCTATVVVGMVMAWLLWNYDLQNKIIYSYLVKHCLQLIEISRWFSWQWLWSAW